MADEIGRNTNPDRSADRRTNAVQRFMFMMAYRRDLREARDLIAQLRGETEAAQLDPDITQANTALRNAVIELIASR